MSDQSPPTFRVELRVLGERVTVEAPQPEGPLRLDEALPFFREIDDQAVALAIGRSEDAGRPISCRKGCSACCRVQPVPVTPPEAHALLRLVEALPEPRREEIRRRFADGVERLRQAGLLAVYLRREGVTTPEQAREVTGRYVALGLACPFLEDDACGIYAARPFVCRQYLVTSPPELCRDPLNNPVEVVPMPVAAAGAALRAAEQALGRPQFTVPLALALEYAAEHRAELEQSFPAQELLRGWLAALLHDTPRETADS